MRLESALPLTSVLVDGDLADNDLLPQLLADFLGMDVKRTSAGEMAAMGAAAAGELMAKGQRGR